MATVPIIDPNSDVVFLETKFCERCTRIWLRERGDDEVYCAPCRVMIALDEETPINSRRAPKLPVGKIGHA